ncbi:MAG: glycosyltransferase [Candidatus Marinimicrobia bacterium]|nr:glycosyltransferase [Candidatus Neomarinimicrobiota bacterium]|tara:strand:- start:5810 stop:6739 length:930 start_codon:yes stop_codon:yes gene_type:complete
MNISIIIPIFNEIDSLSELKNELIKSLSNFDDWEVIFVDDGSSDGSSLWLEELSKSDKHFKLIQFYRNYGKSAALNEGFKAARGDYVITMDADLQDDPAEIKNLVSKLDDGWDLVSGWKKDRLDPLNKRIPSKIFNFVTRILTGVKIHDFNCGLKGYKQAVIKSIEIYGGRHRYIPALAGQRKFKITEIVVNHRARKFGKTKYGSSRLFHGFFDLITILFLNRFNQQPLHLFGAFGIGFFLIGFVLELVVLYYKYSIGDPFSKHIALLILGVMLIVIGIQFFSMGLLGELVARPIQGKEDRVRKFINNK